MYNESPSTASGPGPGVVSGDCNPVSSASDIARPISYWCWWRFLWCLRFESWVCRMLECCCRFRLGAWIHDIGNGGIILLLIVSNDPCYILQTEEEWKMYSVKHYIPNWSQYCLIYTRKTLCDVWNLSVKQYYSNFTQLLISIFPV